MTTVHLISSLKPSLGCKRGPDMSFENNSKLKSRAVLFDFFDDHQANKAESYNGDESGDDEIFLWNLKKSEIQSKARKGGQHSDSHLSTLSADKASRAAMLKKRFASTISKSTRQIEMQKEKERLEIKQLQEKERIDEETKAAEVASMQKKAQCEKEREAARIALEKMERSVVIDDSQEICKEFEMVFRCFQYGTMFPQYQLSPEKALRAEMLLKKRSASTISKVTHQGNMQQEKERLERKQREEKARIEEERKIARMALEKMEGVIMFDDGQEICREFEVQLCCFQYGTMFPH